MRRFNYLGVGPRERLGAWSAALLGANVRGTLVALAAACVAAGLARGIEDQRLAAAHARLEALVRREAAIAPGRRSLRTISSDVARLSRLAAEVHALRVSGLARAAELARIGDAIPAGAWLTALRDTAGGWELAGGARSLGDVASALRRFGALPSIRAATLLSAQSTGDDGTVLDYAMRLERR